MNLKNSKRPPKRAPNHNKKNHSSFYTIFILISILLLVLIGIICYLVRNILKKETPGTNKVVIKQPHSTEVNKTLLTPLSPNSTIIENYKHIFNFLLSKVYNHENSYYMDGLNDFVNKVNPKAINSIEQVYNFNEKLVALDKSIETYENVQPTEEEYQELKLIYFKKIAINFQLLDLTYKIFEDNLINFQTEESKEEKNELYNKFIYQQIHSKYLLMTTLNILDNTPYVVDEEYEYNMKSNTFVKVSKDIILSLYDLSNVLFKNINENIKLDEEKPSIQIYYILSNYKNFRKFIILNFLIIYFNIFEFNENYCVYKVKKEFADQLCKFFVVKGTKKQRINMKESFILGFLHNCETVLENVKEISINIENKYFDGFDENNKICKNALNKVFAKE